MSTDLFGGHFGKWPSGGGIARRPPSPDPEPEAASEALHSAVEEVKPTSPKVLLTNLKWSVTEGEFNEPVEISADVELPEIHKHLTRIEFKVWATTPDGKRELIDKQEGFLRDGTATATVTIFWPAYRENGNLLDQTEMVFTAKHRESKEEESSALPVREPIVPIGKVWVRLLNRMQKPLTGLECKLKGRNKTFSVKTSDKSGELVWEGVKLDDYTLEIVQDQGTIRQSVPWLTEVHDIHIQRLSRKNG